MTSTARSSSAAFDAAVIGSGPNGLSAAIALAQAGRKVVVYELADTVGGGCRTAELTLPGFRHDVCSSIHPMGLSSPFWKTLPLADHGLSWLHSPAVCAHPLADQPAVVQYQDLDRSAQSMGLDRKRYPSTLRTFAERWDELAADGLAPLGIPSSPILMARFGLHAMVPATLLARALFRDPRTQAFFGGHAAHSVLPLDRSPSAAIGLMLLLAGHGVGWPFPKGGAQAITDALASLLQSLGGTIRTGVHITTLDQVETDGPVLFDTGPRALAAIAADALPAGYRKRLHRHRYGPGAFKVDWALSEPIPWADPGCAEAATIHLGGSLDALTASERACWSGEHSDAPYVLLTQPGAFDASRAPGAAVTAWAYCHVPAGSTLDRTAVMEATVEAAAPGFGDVILARHRTTSADLEASNPNYIGGDVNGGSADLDQLFTRPVARLDPYTTPNPRLFLCSASTPPGGGVHGMCGGFAARSVLKAWR